MQDSYPVPLEVLQTGLVLLLEAYDCVRDARTHPAQFAVEIHKLRDVGISDTELRWMCARTFLVHVLETTPPGNTIRSFESGGSTVLEARSCFVLTEKGADFARNVLGRKQRIDAPHTATAGDFSEERRGDTPVWDADARVLLGRHKIVKRFRHRSPIQELVLAAFEQNGWPRRIDDPLPPSPDRWQRLRDTIRRLNKNQENRLIVFRDDGTGERILWDWS